MSEQDTNKNSSRESGVVMVDKSASSKHKPYRPNELQDEPAPDLHKRSKAPAVPSPPEELKNTTVSDSPSPHERMECEHNMASEAHMHVSKTKSSGGKRRGSSPETIAMISRESKKDTIATLPQPIPAQVEAVVSEISRDEVPEKAAVNKTADDDSITEEITELRTSEAVKEHSEWTFCSSSLMTKKEISWQDSKYLDTVQLEDMRAKSLAAILERKASVGPCRHASMLYGGPSGITVCIPKKSVRIRKEGLNPIPSVIDINVSKKMISKSTPYITKELPRKQKKECAITIERVQSQKFFDVLRLKLDTMSSKIRNALKI